MLPTVCTKEAMKIIWGQRRWTFGDCEMVKVHKTSQLVRRSVVQPVIIKQSSLNSLLRIVLSLSRISVWHDVQEGHCCQLCSRCQSCLPSGPGVSLSTWRWRSIQSQNPFTEWPEWTFDLVQFKISKPVHGSHSRHRHFYKVTTTCYVVFCLFYALLYISQCYINKLW